MGQHIAMFLTKKPQNQAYCYT